MRAVVVDEFGAPSSATVQKVSQPTIKDDEVLVEVHAAAQNFVDLLVIEGKYQFLPPRPFTPGKGPAGIVRKKGAAVTHLDIGDRVLAMAEQGGYAQQVAVAAEQCYRLPDSMTYVEAASMSLGFDTAWFALRERGRLTKDDVVLVLGASGAVGLAAVQLAKAMGAKKVLAGLSSRRREQELLDAGADAVIDLSVDNLRDNLREQVYEANDGQGADIVVDMIGGDVFDAAIRAVAWSGRMVIVGFAGGRIPSVRANYLLVKNIEATGLQISDYRVRRPDLVAQCFKEVFGFYEQGLVKAMPATTLALDEFAKGLEMIQNRTAPGRMVLLPQSDD